MTPEELIANFPPDKTMLALPIAGRNIDYEYHTGLQRCIPYYTRTYANMGISNISHSRNECAHVFMEKTDYEWLMWIDCDIAFTVDDWHLLWEGDEKIVIASYARKILGQPPTEFGMGFCRTHRSVFEKIKALTTEDGRDYAQRFRFKGEEFINYFPTGAFNGRWFGEDDGFWALCSLTDCKPRLEHRTKLIHWGNFGFQYPNQIPLETLLMLVEKSGQLEALKKALNESDDGAN